MVARPGFEKLGAALFAGEIGAVLCFDASRLARNGRDWHHLFELCGRVEARVIEPVGDCYFRQKNSTILVHPGAGRKADGATGGEGVPREQLLPRLMKHEA